MTTELLLTEIVWFAGAAMNVGLIIFVLYSTRGKKMQSQAIMFILMALTIVIFEATIAVGISTTSASLARIMLDCNRIDVIMAAFILHWMYAVAGEDKTRSGKITIAVFYAIGAALLIVYAIFPSLMLQAPVPKLYLNFYLNPGPFYMTMFIYFMAAVLIGLTQMLIAYRNTDDAIQRNRYKYVFAAIGFGYIVGPTAFLLVYNIPFDPLWSGFFALYTIPIAYAMVRYELLDIRILAKRAFLYGVSMAFVGVIIVAINAGNVYITSLYHQFPQWIGYVVISVIVGGMGVFVWSKIREADMLKYEFLTIITHKFRTPLTRIKWSAEEALDTQNLSPEIAKIIKDIQTADTELVELTGILTTLNDTDSVEHLYHFKKTDLSEIVNGISDRVAADYASKNIQLIKEIVGQDFIVIADPEKIKFALEILFQNALLYTPKHGSITIHLFKLKHDIVFIISDNGIGISKKDQALLFTKFYRASNARNASTEGAGIGLYMAKKIIERNSGTIEFESAGEDKGSEFTVSFPAAEI